MGNGGGPGWGPRQLSRRRMLQALGVGAGAAALGGVGSSWASSWAAQAPARDSGLLLAPGSRPFPALPEGTVDTMPQIQHVIVYMQENHSYDNYLGMLGRGDGFTLGPGGVPTNSNPDLQDDPVAVFHATSGCDVTPGASQSWNASHLSWNAGAMDGFIRAGGGGIGSIAYWDQRDLPFYYGLGATFPVCDRWFSSCLAQTFPNRRYLQAATSVGIVSTDVNEVLATPDAPNGVIWDRFEAHGISWTDYVIDLPDIYVFPTFGGAHQDHIKKYADFLADCAAGTLPQVSIISPGKETYSEEAPADVQNGEAYSAAIINAVMQSPAWGSTVLFFTYDEGGGYYDHVPPPPAVAPDNIAPRITVPPDEPGDFAQYGFRVPAFVVSPFAKADYVSHVVHDHTSILKFIETKFNLGALTYRDANADDLLDTLDFVNPGFLDPPTLPEPGLPATGSACQPLPRPQQPYPTTTTTTSTTTTTTVPAGDPSGATGAAGAAQPVAATPRFTG